MAMDPSGFSISTTERDGGVIVLVRGELDLATAPDLEEVVSDRMDAGQEVVVDLRELQFMDSSGLRVLVAAHARSTNGGPRFAMVRAREGTEVAKIMSISGVDERLELVDEP
jgi:anti-anti-sigma factor